MTCSAPASVPNSSRSQEPPYYYNTSLTYTCALGHELSSGDAIRTCAASATWSGTPPTCSRMLHAQDSSIAYSVSLLFLSILLTYIVSRLSVLDTNCKRVYKHRDPISSAVLCSIIDFYLCFNLNLNLFIHFPYACKIYDFFLCFVRLIAYK